MEIRRDAMSLSQRLRERVRSTLTNDPEPAVDETETAGRESGRSVSDSFGNLFHCSRCSVVYIATEKRVCSQCEEDVEQVRSTLACQGP
ncbi:hypothetical protein [Natrinema sp. 74]|uniref:hypothetical protein n=1 Tax=Natrinema sp. 74 TaxID=3384159 RepID=UPI0038D4B5C7